MSNSTELPHCEVCDRAITEEQTTTGCRSCQREYHLKCAGVKERDKSYGCASCFQFPGNGARNKLRAPPGELPAMDSISGESSRGHTSESDRTMVEKKEARAKSPSISSVTSRRSMRDETMMKMLETNQQILL